MHKMIHPTNKIIKLDGKKPTVSMLSISFCILQFKQSTICKREDKHRSIVSSWVDCLKQHPKKRKFQISNTPFYELWEHSTLLPWENESKSLLGNLDACSVLKARTYESLLQWRRYDQNGKVYFRLEET